MEDTVSAEATARWPMLYAISNSVAVGLLYLVALTVCIQVSRLRQLCKQQSALHADVLT